MQSIRRILVVIEPSAENDKVESLAMRRACLIANGDQRQPAFADL
jgi:universal stress protein E